MSAESWLSGWFLSQKIDALVCVKDTIGAIEHAAQHMSDSYDEIVETISRQQSRISDLQQLVEMPD